MNVPEKNMSDAGMGAPVTALSASGFEPQNVPTSSSEPIQAMAQINKLSPLKGINTQLQKSQKIGWGEIRVRYLPSSVARGVKGSKKEPVFVPNCIGASLGSAYLPTAQHVTMMKQADTMAAAINGVVVDTSKLGRREEALGSHPPPLDILAKASEGLEDLMNFPVGYATDLLDAMIDSLEKQG